MKLVNYKEDYAVPIDVATEQIDIGREFKFTSEELRNLEEKFYKIFDLNPMPMSISKLKNFTTVDVNESFVKYIGLKDKNDVIGKSVSDSGLKLIRKKDQDFVVNEIITKGEIKNYLCKFTNLRGEKLSGLFSGALIELRNKPCILMICQIVNKKCIFGVFKTLFLF